MRDSPNEEKARIEHAKAKIVKKAVALVQQDEKQKLIEQLHTKKENGINLKLPSK